MRLNRYRRVWFFGAAGILAGCFFIFFFTIPRDTNAGSNHNLSGWAWSENIGWISFNSSNCDKNNNGKSDGDPGCPQKNDPVSSYGVNIASGGDLSGYAWSEHIGWISFNSSDTSGCPAASCAPALNRSEQKLQGWAKALAADGNGWDGWIRLSGANYGVTASGCNYDGYAWGSDVVGWIHFRGANYGVTGSNDGCGIPPNSPPTASGLSTFGGGVSVPPGSGINSGPGAFGENPAGACILPLRPTLSWTYSDPDSDPQKFYRVQVDDSPDFSSPIVDTSKTQSPTNSYILPADPPLAYDTQYYWRVEVWDDRGRNSDWTNGPPFSTQPHQAPIADFAWTPLRPNKNERTQFTDRTQTFGGVQPQSRTWTFQDGAPSTSNQQNPIARFNPIGLKQITLIVSDTDNLSCGGEKTVPVEWPTDPTFREIVPK